MRPSSGVLAALTGLTFFAAPVAHATGSVSVSGGDAIWGTGGVRCSVGFNVHSHDAPALLTAGRCGQGASDWYADPGLTQHIATTALVGFPGNDYVLAIYDQGVSAPSTVNLHDGTFATITSAGDAAIGQRVTRSGAETGVRTGTVTGLNMTVNFPEGTVSGLIRTDICAEPGDNGGSLFDGSAALGLTVGIIGDCASGGESFYEPVPTVLAAVGATIP
ncbi:S1 family peptidase [Amycolatopsis sp. NPDC004079]|uniref:S1 family peptidase n=1 Tax=Amycolatopsis sp. NPDC004079 TaxID=3154549 RepID=UPI0033BB1826